MISEMQGGGLESLIPKKDGDANVPPINDENEIEFRLPDVTGGM